MLLGPTGQYNVDIFSTSTVHQVQYWLQGLQSELECLTCSSVMASLICPQDMLGTLNPPKDKRLQQLQSHLRETQATIRLVSPAFPSLQSPRSNTAFYLSLSLCPRPAPAICSRPSNTTGSYHSCSQSMPLMVHQTRGLVTTATFARGQKPQEPLPSMTATKRPPSGQCHRSTASVSAQNVSIRASSLHGTIVYESDQIILLILLLLCLCCRGIHGFSHTVGCCAVSMQNSVRG